MPTKLFQLIVSEGLEFFTDNQPLYEKQKRELRERKFKQILEQDFQLGKLGKFYKGLNQIIIENKIEIKEKNSYKA